MAVAPRPTKLRPICTRCTRDQEYQREQAMKSLSTNRVRCVGGLERRASVTNHARRVLCCFNQVNRCHNGLIVNRENKTSSASRQRHCFFLRIEVAPVLAIEDHGTHSVSCGCAETKLRLSRLFGSWQSQMAIDLSPLQLRLQPKAYFSPTGRRIRDGNGLASLQPISRSAFGEP